MSRTVTHLPFAELKCVGHIGHKIKICMIGEKRYVAKVVSWNWADVIKHPNVIDVLYTTCDGEERYIIMEYCDTDLFALAFEQQPPLRPSQVPALIRQLCHAVQAVHRAGYMHRDLKTENVLVQFVDDQPIVKLADFDTATRVGYHFYDFAGTKGCMAPEQYKRDYDERVDIWAIGVLCYELICRRSLFDDNVTARELIDFPYESTLAKYITDDTARQFIFHCLRPNPNDRWTIEQLLVHPFLLNN